MLDINFQRIKSIVSSSSFFKGVLALAAVQGVWYALTYRLGVLDEHVHFGFISIFTDQISPFITSQKLEWDWLGEVTRNPSSLYYYIMSFPLRFIEVFTADTKVHIIFLRLIHTVIFLYGLVRYSKFFKVTGVPRIFSNIVLLLLVLTPSVAVIPGIISYDNMQFLFSGILLYQAALMIKKPVVSIDDILKILIIIMVGMLMKYTFIALAAPLCAVVLISIFRRKKAIKITKNKHTFILGALFVFALIFFIERPVQNLVKYQNFSASCVSKLGEERCKDNHSNKRNITALERKTDDFSPKSLYEFTFVDWIPNMIRSQVRLNPWDSPSKVLLLLYAVGFFGGITIVLMHLRTLLTNKYYVLMISAISTFSLILLLNNYKSYRLLAEVVAVSSRYLLPVQPLLMMLVLVSSYSLFKKRRRLSVVILAVTILCFVFGGGVTTYYITADDGAKWSDRTQPDVIKQND
jgi:hypothetical protein